MTKILVGGDFVVGRFRGEMFLNLRLDRQASGGALVIKGVEILRFNGVGHRNDLRVGLLEERTYVGPPLAPATDDGDVHLLARRDKSRAPENVAGNNGEPGNRRSRAANKSSPAQAASGFGTRLVHGLSSASAK